MVVALAVVPVTSRQQRSVGSSVGGAAIGTRCDDWLRPPYYYYAKNIELYHAPPPGAHLQADGTSHA
jgi:hypothetical protein